MSQFHCSRCRCDLDRQQAWCEPCHEIVKAEIRERCPDDPDPIPDYPSRPLPPIEIAHTAEERWENYRTYAQKCGLRHTRS